jgi:hypothetical protein
MSFCRSLPLPLILAGLLASAAGCAESSGGETTVDLAVTKALKFLAGEVPRWSAENRCFSCHNNGDGARTLYTALRLNIPVPSKALGDTTLWLTRPGRWDDNPGEAGFSDKKLARIQFAAALVAASEAGLVRDSRALLQAADLVAAMQNKDGSWAIDAVGNLGSPCTYGTLLASYEAWCTLRKLDGQRFQTHIAKANRFFDSLDPKNVFDAATLLRVLDERRNSTTRIQKCLEIIGRGESRTGGWGPYTNSPPEAFDTAIVLLAIRSRAELKPLLMRGREFLVSSQQADGSWRETTRPPGAQSYALRISTTAWAARSLLLTKD